MQQLLRLLTPWCVVILGMCAIPSCTPKKAPPSLPTAMVRIDSNFSSQSLNLQVWVSTQFKTQDLARPEFRAWFQNHRVQVSQKKDAILLGNFRKYPQAWFYTQVINTTNTSQQLVVDEFNRIRCDDFEVLTFQNGIVKSWGHISRATPFSGHPLPFYSYAVPFTIQPKDTLHLLIHSQRHYGGHEVNLNIATYQTYLSEHIFHFLSKVFQIIFFVGCALIMFVLGKMYRYKTMTYLGFYLLSILFSNLSSWGFTDALYSCMDFIALSGGNSGTFGVFLGIFFYHPFNQELMKGIPKNETVFKVITYSIMGVNLVAACCYLLPASVFNTIYTYIDFPLLLLISLILHLSWLLFCALWALFKAKIYYLIIGLGVAFLPLLLQQLNIFNDKNNVLLQVNQPTFIVYALGLTIISIYLLREQLISRRKHEASLKQVQESLEEIRKTEIETIGRNLHDNVGNILVSATGYLHLQQPKIELSQTLINEAINEIRFLSHNLVKDQDAPLHAKLASLVSRFNDFSETTFVFQDYSNGKLNGLDSIMQQNIYMIVQEVFTNIIKHAKATEVFVQVFEREGNTLQIIIEDDGIGILNFTENKGIGLKNIQKRADISKLTLNVDSTPMGTNFIIETPNMP